MEFFDSHAHLGMDDFSSDIGDVVDRALQRGVKRILCVGSGHGVEGRKRAVELSRRYKGVIFASVGVHPHEAVSATEEDFKDIGSVLESASVVALGEIGLDDVRMISPLDAQRRTLDLQLSMAKRFDLPVIFHVRGAEDEFLDVLKKNRWLSDIGFVVHCFTGSERLALGIVETGGYIGATGIITFSKASDLREVFKDVIPIERCLIETDCPYLAPVPYRGRRNEPSFVVEVASELARLKGLSLEDVGRITHRNASELFRISLSSTRTIAYKIRDSLYLNITNRCFKLCSFCGKHESFVVKGHDLNLRGSEPSFDEIVESIKSYDGDFEEIVFCGYGEPLVRHEIVRDVARWIRKNIPGAKIRLNTDGTAEFFLGKDVLSGLRDLIDIVSVSLNAYDKKTYLTLCKSDVSPDIFDSVLSFIKKAKILFPKVVATAVALPGLDVDRVERLATEELGVEFRLRHYNNIG